jgi:K+-transporting ATPase ATPase C chain
MRRQLAPALAGFLVLTVLTGLAYPVLVWVVGQGVFGDRADGSLVEVDGGGVGSALLGQSFTDPAYLHPRPSAAGDGYDGSASSGSNLGPSDVGLLAAIEERAVAYRAENGLSDDALVPVDAVTASGSGLDPHISVANARLQAERVAAARGLAVGTVLEVIEAATDRRPLGILGEDVVNVLEANVGLDRISGS